MSTNTFVHENLTTTSLNNGGSRVHLDHMIDSLHNEQQITRIPSMDTFDNKSPIIDRQIVENSSENFIIYRYYTGEAGPVIDEHFEKSFEQSISLNSTRSIPTRDLRIPPYGYPSMMNSSNCFWPNFMTPPTYLHPTYLSSSSSTQNDYNDWMHQHHSTYRSPYSTTSSSSNFPSNHLHPIGSPNQTNTNPTRYHHHSPSDMDVVTAAAIGAAAAAQMFHHEKQSQHVYTPNSHHFDYHLGGSMMATTSNPFPGQSFDLMNSVTENSNNKDLTASSAWYSNHHLFC